ncbi:MAG: hypothetical protein IPF55_08265 [Rhodoferax sp.]|nr:hypothetical protein [Rhodoferax sp.]
MAMQSKNYRALYTEYMGIDPALAVARAAAGLCEHQRLFRRVESDYMRQHWINGQRLLARQTGARHEVVADAGHYLQLERPELVTASVQEVLQDVRRLRASGYKLGP